MNLKYLQKRTHNSYPSSAVAVVFGGYLDQAVKPILDQAKLIADDFSNNN